ncbi:hypothetical protein BLNAU_22223 [Blattamonas nauphoetae]|uniref:Uncharacterized protein n=1 Tax=Blattamonas nauphoetae TaxID=2049346 RepID=A0ABQ9WTP2_9EUKA|nr:hypothetical protein BLNAU_22223 [Blattamonas nauphoetae]
MYVSGTSVAASAYFTLITSYCSLPLSPNNISQFYATLSIAISPVSPLQLRSVTLHAVVPLFCNDIRGTKPLAAFLWPFLKDLTLNETGEQFVIMCRDDITLLSTLYAFGHQYGDKSIPHLADQDKPYVFFINHNSEPARPDVTLVPTDISDSSSQTLTLTPFFQVWERDDNQQEEKQEQESEGEVLSEKRARGQQELQKWREMRQLYSIVMDSDDSLNSKEDVELISQQLSHVQFSISCQPSIPPRQPVTDLTQNQIWPASSQLYTAKTLTTNLLVGFQQYPLPHDSAVSSYLSSADVAKKEAQRITDQLSHFILEKGEKETAESAEKKPVQLAPNPPLSRELEKEEEEQKQNEDMSKQEDNSESNQLEGDEEKTAEEEGKENQPPKELEKDTPTDGVRERERPPETRQSRSRHLIHTNIRNSPDDNSNKLQKPIPLPPPTESDGGASDEAVHPKQLDSHLDSRVDRVDQRRPSGREQSVPVCERSVGAVCVEGDVSQLSGVDSVGEFEGVESGAGRGERGEGGEEREPVLRERERGGESDETGRCSASASQSEVAGGAERVVGDGGRGVDASETSEEEREAEDNVNSSKQRRRECERHNHPTAPSVSLPTLFPQPEPHKTRLHPSSPTHLHTPIPHTHLMIKMLVESGHCDRRKIGRTDKQRQEDRFVTIPTAFLPPHRSDTSTTL